MSASLVATLEADDLEALAGGTVPVWLGHQAREALAFAEPSDRVPDPPLPASDEWGRE